METINTIPKWFWIGLGAIALVTIIAVVQCNKAQDSKATNLKQTLGNELTTESNPDVFNSIASIQSMME